MEYIYPAPLFGLKAPCKDIPYLPNSPNALLAKPKLIMWDMLYHRLESKLMKPRYKQLNNGLYQLNEATTSFFGISKLLSQVYLELCHVSCPSH